MWWNHPNSHTHTQSNTHVERFHTKCFRVEEILKWMQDGGEGNVRGRKRGRGGRQARAVYSLLTRQKRFMPATIATTSAIKTATAATNKNVIKIKQKWEVVSEVTVRLGYQATTRQPSSLPAVPHPCIPASPPPPAYLASDVAVSSPRSAGKNENKWRRALLMTQL